MTLGDAAHGRDNNFNLVRLVAALAVLVTHSFAIATGDPKQEPLRGWLGMTLGDFAVDAFFVTSGFLVTASIAKRQSALDFVCARVLRIYPALLLMLALTIFGVGMVMSSLPAPEYLLNRTTLRYAAKCATLLFGVDYVLPGVFEGNPYGRAVNGSLWSMPWELRMYVLLLMLWLGARVSPGLRSVVWMRAVLAVFIASMVGVLCLRFLLAKSEWLIPVHLLYMFFTGAIYFLLRDRIVLATPVAVAGFIALCAAAWQREVFYFVYTLTMAYLVLWLAYVPGGVVRRFNRLGDYSYGTYIYAFPIQQITANLLPGVSVPAMILLSGAATLIMAVASWHLIENRALGLKNALSSTIRTRIVLRKHRNPGTV